MKIQSTVAWTRYLNPHFSSNRRHTSADITVNYSASMANVSDTVSISQTAQNTHADQPNSAAAGNSATKLFDTDQGSKILNIDDYFTPGWNTNGTTSLFQSLPPLLLPTRDNIKALTKHISAVLPRFLADNNIPSAPSNITYDQEGQIQLPADYPYAEQFKLSLANDPAMARELQTVYALSSHFSEMEKNYPFLQEYTSAATQTEARAVIAKYSYLFADNRSYSTVSLHFSENGDISINADGEPLL